MNYLGKIVINNVQTNHSPWKTLSFAISLFIVTIIIYALLALGYIPFLNRSINQLENRIDDLDKRAPQQDIKNRFVIFYSQVVGINALFRSHTSIMPFFDKIESRTKNNIGFSGININVLENMANMEGLADDFNILAGQMILYENIDNVDEVILSSANTFEHLVRFNLRINFNNDFFKFNQAQQPIDQNINQDPTSI